MTGLIDEVRVYNRVLRDHEIQVLASQSLVSADGLTVSFAASSMPEKSGSTQATVTRSGSTAESLVVTLGSSDTTEATVPSTVTIAAGQASATFTVSSVDDAVRDGTQNVTVTASATGLLAGSGRLQVTDDEKLLVHGVVTNVTQQLGHGQLAAELHVDGRRGHTQLHEHESAGGAADSQCRGQLIRTARGSRGRTDRCRAGVTVHYVVAEEGVYTLAKDGVKMEAVKYVSTVTDSASSFVGESRSYAQSYVSPVVLGQVQTYNDAELLGVLVARRVGVRSGLEHRAAGWQSTWARMPSRRALPRPWATWSWKRGRAARTAWPSRPAWERRRSKGWTTRHRSSTRSAVCRRPAWRWPAWPGKWVPTAAGPCCTGPTP